MSTRLLQAVLLSLIGCGLALRLAHAEIYTWVDPSGTVNVSNLAPPEGVRVTTPASQPVATVAPPMAEEVVAAVAAPAAEPEVVTERKPKEEDEAAKGKEEGKGKK
jgi:hypothetical protein